MDLERLARSPLFLSLVFVVLLALVCSFVLASCAFSTRESSELDAKTPELDAKTPELEDEDTPQVGLDGSDVDGDPVDTDPELGDGLDETEAEDAIQCDERWNALCGGQCLPRGAPKCAPGVCYNCCLDVTTCAYRCVDDVAGRCYE